MDVETDEGAGKSDTDSDDDDEEYLFEDVEMDDNNKGQSQGQGQGRNLPIKQERRGTWIESPKKKGQQGQSQITQPPGIEFQLTYIDQGQTQIEKGQSQPHKDGKLLKVCYF